MNKQDNIIAFPGNTRGSANAPRLTSRLSAEAGQAQAKVLNLAAKRAVRPRAVAEVTRQRPLTINEVWDALNEARIEMHYQPQYDLATGEIIAAEALLRLVDGQGQLVYPDRFIELVEHSDLIVPLGRAVIERVCANLVQIRADGGVLPHVAINLAAHQLNSDDGLVGFIDDTLAEHGLAYADLEFELTERQRLDTNGEGSPALVALATRGAKITIDDFGIGYSSVVCLTELPIGAFKLDRALIGRLPEDETMQSVVTALLKLAEHLKLDVVAEGVETQAQHQWLTDAGCPAVQGFGYAKPMPLDQLQALLVEGARSGISINAATLG